MEHSDLRNGSQESSLVQSSVRGGWGRQAGSQLVVQPKVAALQGRGPLGRGVTARIWGEGQRCLQWGLVLKAQGRELAGGLLGHRSEQMSGLHFPSRACTKARALRH